MGRESLELDSRVGRLAPLIGDDLLQRLTADGPSRDALLEASGIAWRLSRVESMAVVWAVGGVPVQEYMRSVYV